MSTVSVQRTLTRALYGALAAATLLVIAGLLFQRVSALMAGILLATVVLLGASAPGRLRLNGTFQIANATPTETDPTGFLASLSTNARRTHLCDWRLALPGTADARAGDTTGTLLLRPRRTEQMRLELSFLLFGLQKLGPMRVRTGDPFGFATADYVAGNPQYVRVYPRSEGIRETAAAAKMLRPTFGAYEVPRPGYGMEFFGLREYQVGDRPRDINWKASARTGNILVNQHEKETDNEIVIFLDVRAVTGVGLRLASPFAVGGRAALSIAIAHLRGRDAVRLVAYGQGIVEDRHTGAVRRLQGLLDLLVGMSPSGDTSLLDAVQTVLPSLRRHSPVFILSPLVDDPTVEGATAILRSQEFSVRCLVTRPSWGDQAQDLAAVAWDAKQAVAMGQARTLGIRLAPLQHGQRLELALSEMELMGQ